MLLCDCARLVVVCSCCCCHHKCIPRSVVAVILATSHGEAPSDNDDNNDHAGRASCRAATMAATHLPTHPLAERLEHQPRHDVFFVLVAPTCLRCLCCRRHPPPKTPLPRLAERDLQEITHVLPAAPSSSSFAMPLPLSPSRSSRPMNNAPMSIAGINVVAIGKLPAAAAAAAVALPIAAPIEQRRALSRRRRGLAPLHLSYSSSSVAAATDMVPLRVFVVAASVGSFTPDGGSGSAAGAIVDDNANRGHDAVATATGPDVGVGGGSSTDRDNDDHGVYGDRAVVMMTIAGKRGGEATARRQRSNCKAKTRRRRCEGNRLWCQHGRV